MEQETRRAAMARLGFMFTSLALAGCGGSGQGAAAPMGSPSPAEQPPAPTPAPARIAKQYVVTATGFAATDFKMSSTGLMAGYMAGADQLTHVFLKDGATLGPIDLPLATGTPALAAMNNAGDLLLVAARASDGLRRSYLARRDGTIKSIGEFTSTDYSVVGSAVNGAGVVIGQSSRQGFVDGPFGFWPVPTIGNSEAKLLNELGWVAGWSDIGPYVWSVESGTKLLAPINDQDVGSNVAAINSTMVIGYYALGPFGRHEVSAFRAWSWTPAGGKQLLSDTQGGIPAAVNEAGLVVGSTEVNPKVFETYASVAFAWTAQAGFRQLPPLGQRSYSAASSVNAAGLIGGYASFGGYYPQERATVWTLDEGPVDLNTFVQSAAIPTLVKVAGISDAGAIAAVGSDWRIYLATPVP